MIETQARIETDPELESLIEAGVLKREKAEALAEHHRSEASTTALRAVLSIFVTLAAASIMSISFIALIAITIRDPSPELMFFLALGIYGGLAYVLGRFKLRIPAATLASIGLVTGAIAGLAADSYPALCLVWFAALGLALALTRRVIDHALLTLTGAGVLFALICRAFSDLELNALRLASGSVSALGFGILVWSRAWTWRSLVGERRLKPLYEALGLLLGLGGLFLIGQRFQRGAYETPEVALGLLAFVVYTAAAALTRRRPALFGIALGHWILFLFWKYYELFYDLLGGSLILLALGLALLGLARLFGARADREDRKADACAS